MTRLILVAVFIAVKRLHAHGNSYKEGISLRGLAYSFRGSVQYDHDGEHDSIQADVVVLLHLRRPKEVN